MPDADVAGLRQAFTDTFKDPALADCREKLLLGGLSLSCQEDYWVHEAFNDHAHKSGFAKLQ